jgi:hypothetical protein
MAAVAVEDMAAHVVAVLTRAESLFADAAGAESVTTADQVSEAAGTARRLTAGTADMSGAIVATHRDLAAASAEQLDQASGVDARLADHLGRTAALHGAGLSQAGGLRAGAAEVRSQLAPWAEVPASELAGLKMLRNHLAAMQRLLAQHNAVAARTAADISTLSYLPGKSSPQG